MNNPALWQISVTTSAGAEEAVAALLEKLHGQTPSVYLAAECQKPIITTYSSKPVPHARSLVGALARGLKQLEEYGLDVRPAKITVSRVPREDWTESWKKYFKTLVVGRALLIKPSWSKRRPRKGQAVVVIDPGLSFGTGQHPTTSFCLSQLATCRKKDRRQAFLDVGTGSGILAVAAAKLGYEPVRAFDLDPVAVRVAKANAKRNATAERVSITRQDLSRLSVRSARQYDVICANLISDVLIKEATRLVSRLRTGGRLVLAGILTTEFARVEKVYSSAGLKLLASRTESSWRSGMFG